MIKFVRYCGGSTRFGRRVDDKVGFVAEITEGFCQKTEVAVPEELIGADGEVGVQKDFQKSYKIPKRTKRSRLLRFRTRGFVHQERRFRVKNHKLCKNKRL